MGLAPMLVRRIFEIVGRLNRRSAWRCCWAEQNANMALRFAQYVYVMENGGWCWTRRQDGERERGHQGVLPGAVRVGCGRAIGTSNTTSGESAGPPCREGPDMSSQLQIVEVSKSFGGVLAVNR